MYRFCICKNRARECTSWRDHSAGRRFITCASNSCTFWEWIDPPMCQRSTQIIPGLLRRITGLERTIEELQMEKEALNKKIEKMELQIEGKSGHRKIGVKCVLIGMCVVVVIVLLLKSEDSNQMQLL